MDSNEIITFIKNIIQRDLYSYEELLLKSMLEAYKNDKYKVYNMDIPETSYLRRLNEMKRNSKSQGNNIKYSFVDETVIRKDLPKIQLKLDKAEYWENLTHPIGFLNFDATDNQSYTDHNRTNRVNQLKQIEQDYWEKVGCKYIGHIDYTDNK